MRPSRLRTLSAFLSLTAGSVGALAAASLPMSVAPQALELDVLLERASAYVARFDAAFANVVAEERYTQRLINARGATTRRRELVSDFLMVKLPIADGWLPFRDVFSVDGRPIRDADGRLVKLLAEPDPLALFQAQAIVAESATQNIGVSRTMNLPILALQVLRAADHARFSFSNVKPDALDGADLFRLDYREHAQPTMILGPGGRDMPVSGQIWLQADGTVVQTELRIDHAAILATMTTRYAPDAALGVSMPVEMREEYVEPNRRRTAGHATYSRFRRFGVETSSDLDAVRR